MEAVPRLPMISCDMKISPSNTEFGPVLKKFVRDHYHEDPESYNKEIKELETLRQNAIKAPMDFTGCSILKRYYSQLHKLQSRFPMTDDGPACVPFMWTDIYSGVAYNITDIEYEEACILYNIGALHSKLGTMDSRSNAEGMKIACTHFQCAAWAFQHLRDTYPQPKGSDMSHDLLTFFINIMLAQAQECILEKSMLDSRKSSITAKIAAQVVDYYKCALGIMVSGSPSTDTGSVLDIVGSKIFKGWKKFIEFKMAYYTSISHLYMGNQAEENEKWGERVAWFQSAFDQLNEAFKIAKNIDRDDLNEPLTFTMDVVGGKHNSSKKENEFVYHDKVPALSSLPELKGASLVKGIPFSITDSDVSGPDIFARLVPMEAHETSSLYSEEKAKLLRMMVAKIEGKNEELIAYLSSLQIESALTFQNEENIPQELIETCAAMSVRPDAVSDLRQITKDLMHISDEVNTALKSISTLLQEEEKKELRHQETFGKRGPNMIITELKKEFSKYEEAHKKAIESNNTLEMAVNIHIDHLSKLYLPLQELADMLPSFNSIKTPENVKATEEFNHLVEKVEEMKKQREYLEQLLRDSLLSDDITKSLVTMKKKEDLQQVFVDELKKHAETVNYLEQNLAAQDKILCALTEANACYAETRKAMLKIRSQRNEMVNVLVNSVETYDDLMSKVKKGTEFYQKLQSNVNRLLSRVRSVTKVQDEERSQIANADLRKGSRNQNVPPESYTPKLKDYLPYMTKQGGVGVPGAPYSTFPPQPSQASLAITNTAFVSEPMRQATLGGPATSDLNRKLKPGYKDQIRPEDNYEIPSMGVRPAPVGSDQVPTVPPMCTTAISNSHLVHYPSTPSQQWSQAPITSTPSVPAVPYGAAYAPYQYPSSAQIATASNSSTTSHSVPSSNVTYSQIQNPNSFGTQNYDASMTIQNNMATKQYNSNMNYQQPVSPVSGPVTTPLSTPSISRYGVVPASGIPSASVPLPQMNGNFPPVTPVSNIGSQSGGATSSSGITLNGAVPPTAIGTGAMPYSREATLGSHSFSNLPSGYNLPQSQRTAIISSSSSMTSLSSGQTQPSWQGMQQMNQYTPPSYYNVQTSMYDQKPVSNISYQSVPGSVQYYPPNIQPGLANVTASMDTRTSTFNSTQNISATNQSISYQNPPGSINYSMPSIDRTFTNTTSVTGAVNSMQSQYCNVTQMQNYMNPAVPAKFSNDTSGVSANIYGSTIPNSVPPNQAAYYSYVPQGTQSTSNSLPSVVNSQTPNATIPQSPAGSTYLGSGFITQENNQPLPSSFNQHTYTMANTNMVHSSSFSAQNQAFQPPAGSTPVQPYQAVHPSAATVVQTNNQLFQAPQETIPATVHGQTLHPLPSVSVQSNKDLSPSVTVQSVCSENSHVNTIRDLITPPLETESTHSTDVAEKEPPPPVLQPQVIDIKSIAKVKEKEQGKDPLDDPAVRSKFVSEVEKYEKFVDGLVRKSLNGTTPLDQKWKEMIDVQDKESRKLSISVARCYPLKNRFPDVMPYDSNRVKLVSAKDDYINASFLKDICPSSPVFVITQAPLPTTFTDFWLMVWEQQVETLICLLPDSEMKNHVYFPKERSQVLSYGAFEITLHSNKEKNGFVEKMINVTHIKNRNSRVVVHLQFTQWPVSGIPQSPAPLLQFISDVLSYQKQQRNLLRPVVVHCSAGIGRSGCFCLITALVNEMNSGHGPRDVAQVLTTISLQRKFLIQDKEQLKFCYDSVLYYAQDLLMRRGILTTRASFDDKLPTSGTTISHVRHPSEDFILGGGLAKLQSGVEKMGLSSNQQVTETTTTETNFTEITTNKTEDQGNGNSVHDGSGDDVPIENPPSKDSEPAPVLSEEKIEIDEVNSLKDSKDCKYSTEKNLPSITSLLDPSNFTLDGAGSPAKRKITKENFIASRGSLSTSSSDSADPLSQLDPLWSLKK